MYQLIDNMPEDEYHAIEALGSTAIKGMAVSPAYFQQQKMAMGEKKAFELGTLFHEAILEPHKLDDYIAPPTTMVRDGKTEKLNRTFTEGKQVWKEYLERAEGKKVIETDVYNTVMGMAKAFRQTDAYANMMNGDISTELSVVGPAKKARFDLLKKHPKGFYVAYDLKTSSREFPQTERDWQRWFIKWGYHMQAAWYIHVASLAGIKIAAFNFVVVSAKAPYEHAVIKLGAEFLQAGTEKVLAAFDLYKKCTEEDRWPGSFEMQGKPVLEIPMPAWGL